MDGAFWSTFLALMNKACTLVGQFALAYILLPADIGIARLALAVASFAMLLSVSGIGDVLLQRGRYEEEASAGFWLSLLFNLIVAVSLMVVGSGASLVGRPQLKGLLAVCALGPLLSFPASVLSADMKNRLDFKGYALSQALSGVVYTGVAVSLAWCGFGAYSLVIAGVVRPFSMMLAMLGRGTRFRLQAPEWRGIRVLVRPTIALSLADLSFSLQFQTPVLVCGWYLDARHLGYFSWGWSVAGQTVFLVATNLKEVLMPVFTRVRDEHGYRDAVALRSARAITALLCVVCGVQALLARPALAFLLPKQWQPAVPVIVLASVGLISQGLQTAEMSWMNSVGKYRALLMVSFFQTGIATLLTVIGLRIAGIPGAVVGCGLGYWLGAVAGLLPMQWEIVRAGLRTWAIPLAGSLALGTLCLALSFGKTGGEMASAVLFACGSFWLWWCYDDGGLNSIWEWIRAAGVKRGWARD